MTELADEKYLRLTTFTKDGRPKHTPVWIAPLHDGRLGFTTETGTWKVKRIGHTPRVELAPSSARGVVDDDAPVTSGTASVVTGDEFEVVDAAIKAKYGFQVTLIRALGKIRERLGRAQGDGCGVVIAVD